MTFILHLSARRSKQFGDSISSILITKRQTLAVGDTCKCIKFSEEPPGWGNFSDRGKCCLVGSKEVETLGSGLALSFAHLSASVSISQMDNKCIPAHCFVDDCEYYYN